MRKNVSDILTQSLNCSKPAFDPHVMAQQHNHQFSDIKFINGKKNERKSRKREIELESQTVYRKINDFFKLIKFQEFYWQIE